MIKLIFNIQMKYILKNKFSDFIEKNNISVSMINDYFIFCKYISIYFYNTNNKDKYIFYKVDYSLYMNNAV